MITAALNPLQSEVLAYRQKGWTYQKIAHHMGIPIGTVRSALHYARKYKQLPTDNKKRTAQ